MWDEETDNWGCDLCCESIEEGEPLIRVAADSAFSDGVGGCEVNRPRRIMLLAVFHSKCILETMHDDDYLQIDYVREARDIVNSSPLCECCKTQATSPKQRRAHFRLIEGGA